uniref:Peptidase S1 domain-containing protein n=1 Tax=Hucho hucho TaxID=62062 RepID=A0A4W5LEC4_9TELE
LSSLSSPSLFSISLLLLHPSNSHLSLLHLSSPSPSLSLISFYIPLTLISLFSFSVQFFLIPFSRPLTFILPPLFSRRESADLWKVVLGINNLDHPSPYLQTRGVESIIVHPRYNRAVVDYDISVVELDREVEVTSYVRPVCLPSNGQLPQPDTYCYITGWGHMGNRMPFKLQEGEVRIISRSQCQSYFDMKTITTRMLCAGYEAGTVDSCMVSNGEGEHF